MTGNSGSGKSTFAVTLGSILDLPVIHLDQLYWQPDGMRVPQELFWAGVEQAVQSDRWVFEGFNIETFDLRASRADTIVFLDISRLRCVWRLATGRGHRLGVPISPNKTRVSLRAMFKFLRWVWIFPSDRRPGTLEDLARHREKAQVIYLRSPKQVKDFLRKPTNSSRT